MMSPIDLLIRVLKPIGPAILPLRYRSPCFHRVGVEVEDMGESGDEYIYRTGEELFLGDLIVMSPDSDRPEFFLIEAITSRYVGRNMNAESDREILHLLYFVREKRLHDREYDEAHERYLDHMGVPF